MHSQGIFILSVSWAVVAATGGMSQTMGAQSVPDFSGVWGHPPKCSLTLLRPDLSKKAIK